MNYLSPSAFFYTSLVWVLIELWTKGSGECMQPGIDKYTVLVDYRHQERQHKFNKHTTAGGCSEGF